MLYYIYLQYYTNHCRIIIDDRGDRQGAPLCLNLIGNILLSNNFSLKRPPPFSIFIKRILYQIVLMDFGATAREPLYVQF